MYMLAWKAQWGILENNVFTPYDDTIFTIPTKMELEPDYINQGPTSYRSTYKHSFNSQPEAANFIEEVLGVEDYVTLTPLQSTPGKKYSDNYNIMFPAWASAYPNAIEYAKEAGAGSLTCYIPSLHRYIKLSGTTPAYVYIYDESFEIIFSEVETPFTYFQQISMYVLAYVGSKVEKIEMLKPSNYKFLGLLSDPKYFCSKFTDDNDVLSEMLSTLFASFAPPDEIIGDFPPEPDPPSGDIDVGTGLPGGYDPNSDEIPWGVDTWLSAASLGMCTVYNPTASQVRDLATRLYSKDFQSGFENYIWGNPIGSIIGLSIMPCSIPNAGTATVKSWGLDTGVTMNLASNTLVHVDCGQLSVPKVYSGYLDYSPYTQVEIYIPYVGFIGLDADDIMGQTLQLHYYIDIISGTAAAKLVISNTSTTTVLGQWSCQVGRQIPVGSRDYNDIINSGIQLVAAAVGAYSGSVIPEVVTDLGDALQYEGGGFNGTRFFTQMLRAGSSAIMQAKPNITRGSSIASASGQLAVQYPYLILKRPVSAKTNGYGALVGYPTFKYGTIGEYKGFVRCHNIKLDNIGCTDWELSEIFKLCCEGVYI